MKRIVCVINGKGGVGKDSLISALAQKYKVVNISSVGVIKQVATQLGWNPTSKTLKDRKFLADLKQLSVAYNNQPLEYLLANTLKWAFDSNIPYLFVHIREPEEIAKYVKGVRDLIADFDDITVQTCLVTRTVVSNSAEYGNLADDAVEQYDYTVRFSNDKPFEESSLDFIALFEELRF